MSDYAWIIDRDHLYETFKAEDGETVFPSAVGVVGPGNAKFGTSTEDHEAKHTELGTRYQHRNAFKMYDDDGELYYSGYLYWDGEIDDPDEHQIAGPLDDYGMPGSGCTRITYHRKPEWEIG